MLQKSITHMQRGAKSPGQEVRYLKWRQMVSGLRLITLSTETEGGRWSEVDGYILYRASCMVSLINLKLAQHLQRTLSSPSLPDMHIKSAQVYSHSPHTTTTQYTHTGTHLYANRLPLLMHRHRLQQCVFAFTQIYQFVSVCA